MAQETTLLDIDFGSTLDRIQQITKATADLRKENEELAKAVDGDSEAIKKLGVTADEAGKKIQLNQAAIRVNAQEQRTLNKVIDDSVKANKAQVGSIEANRIKLRQLTEEYKQLANPTKEQTDRLKSLSDRLKEQEGAIGNNTRNVGNYTESIKQATSGISIFGVNVGNAASSVKNGAKGFTEMAKGADGAGVSFKGLGKAIALTGFGLLFIAIGAVVGALSKLEPIANKISGIFNGMSAAFTTVVGATFKFISAVASGENVVESFSNSFTGLGSAMAGAAKEAHDLTLALDDLEDAQHAQSVLNAQSEAQVKNLLIQANDRTLSEKERLKLLEEAGKIEQENFQQKLKLAEREKELAQQAYDASVKANGVAAADEDLLHKLQESQIALIQTRSESADVQEKIDNRLNKIKDEAADKEEKRAAKEALAMEKKKAADEKEAEKEKKRQELLAEIRERITDELGAEIAAVKQKAKEYEEAGATETEVAQFTAIEMKKIEEKKSDLILKEIDKRLKDIERGNASEILLTNDKYSKLIIAARGNADEVARLEKGRQRELLEIQRQALQEQLQQLQEQFESATASSEGGLIAGALGLTDEGRQELEDRINEAKAKLEELGFTIANISTDIDTGKPKDLLHALGLDDEGVEQFNATIGFISDSIGGISDLITESSNQRVHALEREKEAAIALAGDSAEARASIEEDFNRRIEAEKKKAFEQTKKIKVVESIISTAQAVINAYNSGLQAGGPLGPVVGALFAAVAAGIGIAQTALIAKQKYAEGGEVGLDVGGRSHAEGGTTYVGEDGNAFEVERGEKIYVLKKTAAQYPMLSALNQKFGGRSWGSSGVRHAAEGGNIAFASTLDGGLTAREATESQTKINIPDIILKISELHRVEKNAQQSVGVSEL